MINMFINGLKNFLRTNEKTIVLDRESAIKVLSEFEYLKKKHSDLIDAHNISNYDYERLLSSRDDYKARLGEKVKELYKSNSHNKELQDKVKRLDATMKLHHDKVMCDNLKRSIDLIDLLNEPEP